MPKVSIGDRLKAKGVILYSNKNPLWKGPRDSGPMGGITQSMISRWLCCRERFRLKVIEGFATREGFNARIDYGNMWHVCEEAHASKLPWQDVLKGYCQELVKNNKENQQSIVNWYEICKLQFPLYIKRWAGHKHVVDRTPLYSEKVFQVPYKTEGGNVVYLRGKLDSADIVGKEVWVQENKTKGDIEEETIKKQMNGDLQSMIYLIVVGILLGQETKFTAKDIAGVRYNVVRRPLSGGKHSIKQRKGRMTKKGLKGAESDAEFRERLNSVISENLGDFFFRVEARIYRPDLVKFRHQCLDPILDQICEWYESVTEGHYSNGIHYRFPYGVFNPTLEGYGSDMDHYLNSGSTMGLTKVKVLFRELQ